jgi:hypothetical protein
MSSKRQLRRKACTRKRRYQTRQAADIAARRTNNRDGRLVAYKCDFCGGFHVGHSRAARSANRRKSWFIAAVHGVLVFAMLAAFSRRREAEAWAPPSIWLKPIPGVSLWYTVNGERPVDVSQGGPVYLWEGDNLVLHGVVDVDGDRKTGLPEATWALQVVNGTR